MVIENTGCIDLKEFNNSFSFENEIIRPNQEKRYKFTVTENTVCNFSLNGEDCDYLSWQIFDSNGEEIYFDSELTELAPGTYYCNVYSYNDVNCNFALNFEKAEDLGAIKQNSSFDIQHNGYNKNSDLYTFSLDSETFININVRGSKNYSYLTVYNSDGEEIYFDDKLFLEAGKYFVKIEGEYSDIGSYELDFVTAADLGTVTDSVSFDNSDGKSQTKTLSFNIAEGGLYDIDFLSKNESYFTLYNSNGEEIYYDTYEYLEAGKYYVKINSYYDEYGYYDNAYTFNVQKIVSDRAEKNDSFETAYDLGEISSFNIVKDMSFHSAYDPDFYKVTITQDSIWTISTSQYEQDIRIYDKNYDEIYLYEYNPVLKAGEYFIEVNSYAPDTYSLYFNKAATLTLQDTYTQANFTYSGCYEFTLSEDCMLNIFNAEQDFYDVSFSIFDADGNMVDAPHYNYILEKGKYYISAEGYSYDEYGDSEFSIYFVKAEKLGTLTDSISFSASDYTNNYEFNLTEDGTWLIGTDSEFCDMDIYDVNGEYIYLKDNNNYLEAGKYFIQVNVHDAEYASGYNLNFTSVKPDYAENNDSMQNAYDFGTISDSQTFNNLTIHNSEDRDYYKFTLTEDTVLDISLSAENAFFDIYTADGNYFYPDYNNPLFKAGTYFIKFETSEISSYELNINKAQNVGTVGASHTFAGTLASNENKYYEFTIAENSMCQINSGNTYYNLYNSDGEEIWLDDYTYSFLAAGKYYLRITGPEGDYYNQRQKDYNIEFKSAENLGTLTDSITVNNEGVFEFNIAESGTWDISINNSYYDYEMYLYNANGEEIYLYDNENYLAAGKYFISVNSYDYNLDISFNIDRISPDFAEDNNSIQTAYDFGTLTDSVTYENLTLHNYDDKDYYKFTISETDLWKIGGNFNFEDISFEILDMNHESVYSTEDSDMYLLTAGTYYISIEGYECVEKYSLDLNKSEDLGVLTETTQINVSTSSDLAYRFTISETGTWKIPHSESTYYLLYNEYGRQVDLYDNNFVLNAGTYYICIPVSDEYEHDYKRDITLTLENIKPDIYDSAANNDTIYTAADLGEITGDKVFADLSLTCNDSDFYKFTITEDGVWDIGLTEWSENISIEFFDSNGKSIEPEFGYFTPGTYFVNVQCYDIPENYSLKFENIKPDYAEDNNSIFTAYNLGTISESKTFSDLTFHSYEDTDYFKFTVTESGYWQISNGLGYDYGPYLYVTDADNEDIYSDDGNYFFLNKGTYFIQTEGYGYPEKYSIHLNKAENLGTFTDSTEFSNLTSNDYYVTYEFNIAETGVWQISLTENNLPPWSDGGYSEMYIRDSNGEEIYLWDNIPIFNAGKYFISFYSSYENGGGDYNLKFTKAYDFGVIDAATSVSNTISGDQSQYYEFTLTESSMLNIYTSGTNNGGYEEWSPVYTTVRNADGEEIYFEENNLLTAGKYYISVYSEYMDYGNYEYSLVIDKAENIEIINNSFTIATTLENYQAKYYEFTLTESSMYNISATDDGYGSIYSIINADGEEIYLEENGYLSAGKYFMVLRDEYSNYGSLNCTVTLSQAQNLGTVETFTTFDVNAYLNSGISDFSIEVDVTLPSDSPKYFEFTLAEDGFCNIGVFNSSDSAYYTLYDSNGEEVYYDEFNPLLKAGKYYISCSGDSASYNDKYHITLMGAYDFGTVTETKSTEVMEYTPAYYQFTLNESQTVSIDVFSQYNYDDYCYISLYNENFEEVYSEYNEFDDEVYYLDTGKYYFSLSDYSGYNSVVSIKIPDLTPPEAPATAQNITAITSDTVLVEASFSSDTVFKEYSFDGKKWMIYSEPVAVDQNGTVYFRGSDADGNQSDFTVHEVKNIDKTPPVISNIKADITGDTRTAVTISADFADDNNFVRKEYRIEGGEWQTYIDGVVMTFNGTVYFRATDAAGNVSEASHSINNILAAEHIFIKSSFNSAKTTGKKQDGVTLVWHENAFESFEIAQELLKNKNTSASEFIFLDSKVNFDNYENIDKVTNTVAAVKEKGDINSNSYSRQESVSAKNTLNVNGKNAENVDFNNFATVNLTNSDAGEISGGKASDSTTLKVTEKKGVKTVTETNKVSQTASGKVTATNSTAENLVNYATVNLDGSYIGNIVNNAYTLNETIKTVDGVETVNRTEQFTASGTVTLKNGASASNINNYKTVKITDSIVGTIESFAVSKIVNEAETRKLAGTVTLTDSEVNTVSNYSQLTMTDSSVKNIANVNKVTISKGFNDITSYIGTDGNDTLTISKNAVLTLGTADFKAGTKDKLANNGTLILSAAVDISTLKISGKGEIAAASNVWHNSWIDYPVINLGATADGFRTTKYELADNTEKKAAKWDLKADHQGWLSGDSSCIDLTDFVKFKTGKESELLEISGFDANDTVLLNGVALDYKDGKFIAELAAKTNYTLELTVAEGSDSMSYTLQLA